MQIVTNGIAAAVKRQTKLVRVHNNIDLITDAIAKLQQHDGETMVGFAEELPGVVWSPDEPDASTADVLVTARRLQGELEEQEEIVQRANEPFV